MKDLKKKGVRRVEKVEKDPKMIPFADLPREVFNPDGQQLGKVEDVILDITNQRISFGILSFGGIFGLGEERFAIPWGLLDYSEKEGNFKLNIQKEKLQSAVGFEPNKYPYPAFGPWAGSLYGYWGYLPYWPIR